MTFVSVMLVFAFCFHWCMLEVAYKKSKRVFVYSALSQSASNALLLPVRRC